VFLVFVVGSKITNTGRRKKLLCYEVSRKGLFQGVGLVESFHTNSCAASKWERESVVVR